MKQKLEDANRDSDGNNQLSPAEMEDQVFRQATSLDEYIKSIAILLSDIKHPRRAAQSQDGSQQGTTMEQLVSVHRMLMEARESTRLIREARQGNEDYIRELQNEIQVLEEIEFVPDEEEQKPSRGG